VRDRRAGALVLEAAMRLRRRRRPVVIWRSSDYPAVRYTAPPPATEAPAHGIRRWLRIGALVTVIAVRPRWKPLLAGVALLVFGLVEHSSPGAVAVIPGLMMLYAAALIPGDSDFDHQRRQQLIRELGGYSTPAQQRDLKAALDQYPDGVTGELREILPIRGAPVPSRGLPGAWRY
jgi:hypothetical protein